jgi:flagellar hook-length control protein FliK
VGGIGRAPSAPTFERVLPTAAVAQQPSIARGPALEPIVEHVLAQARALTQGGQTTVRMRLQPEALGTVDVHVTERNGHIEVRLAASDPAAAAALKGGVERLRQGLVDGGAQVQRIEVSATPTTAGANNDAFSFGQPSWSADGRGQSWTPQSPLNAPDVPGLPVAAVTEDDASRAPTAPTTRQGIDYRV